jgi:hypothetical protein
MWLVKAEGCKFGEEGDGLMGFCDGPDSLVSRVFVIGWDRVGWGGEKYLFRSRSSVTVNMVL